MPLQSGISVSVSSINLKFCAALFVTGDSKPVRSVTKMIKHLAQLTLQQQSQIAKATMLLKIINNATEISHYKLDTLPLAYKSCGQNQCFKILHLGYKTTGSCSSRPVFGTTLSLTSSTTQ